MWDRFPPRMRRVLIAALDKAGRQGHDTATAEHLLLAVLDDPQSGGAIIFGDCGIDSAAAIRQLTALAPANGHPLGRAEKLDPSALHLLDVAVAESDRLADRHVGTEHLALAISKLNHLPAGKALADLGLTPAYAEQAVHRWSTLGMPRPMTPQGAQPTLLRKILRAPRLAWNVYIKKSLGHPRFVTDPYPLYKWLRRHAPVRKDPLAPVWVVSRYDDIAKLLRDRRFLKDPFAADRLPKTASDQLGARGQIPHVNAGQVSMLFLDPPQHTRVRSSFTRAFTPATLTALRPRIEQIAAQCLDRIAGSAQADLISALAYPLPVIVIAELLGFAAGDFEKFKRWSDDMAAALALNATAADQTRAADAREQLQDYFVQRLPEFRRQREQSLIGRLLAASAEPDALNIEEIFTNSVLLLAAGHETTTNLIGNGILALMRHRDQWDALVADPTLIESAVEEILRFDSPVQWVSRVSGEPIELANQTIPPESIILAALGSANRDPSRFPHPDRFDIRRPDNKHLAFSTGVHFCLGAALARMEAQIALRLLIDRFPQMRLARSRLNWMPGLTFRGVKSLPVQLK